jgi:hypothetical protein
MGDGSIKFDFVLTLDRHFLPVQRVFAGFLLGYAAFLVYSSFHHAWSPWELVSCL